MSRVRTTAQHLRRAQQWISPCFWKTPIRIEFTLSKTSGKSVDIFQFWNGSIGSTRRFFMPSSNWSWRKICHEMDRCILFMNVRNSSPAVYCSFTFSMGFQIQSKMGILKSMNFFIFDLGGHDVSCPATGRSLVCHWISLLPWWRDLVKSYW